MAMPAAAADEAPPGTVLLPQGIDYTQQEIDDNWGPDRSAPSVAPTSVSFDGRDDVLHYGVDSDNPTADESDSTFWRTEGIKSERDLGVAIETDLYIDPAWEDRAVRAGIWTVGEDVNGDRANGFGIIEFSTARGWAHPDPVEKDEGWRVWVSGGGWVNLETDFTYGEWANLRIELNVTDQVYGLYIDGSLEASIAIDLSPSSTNEAVGLSEVFLNSYNYGYQDVDPSFSNDSYDVHWHGLDFLGAFDSVRDALDAAQDGDTLDIGPGVYDEGSSFWRIDKSVTLRGAGSDLVTIDRSAADSYGLVVDTDDVSLEGFTFIGSQTGPVEYGLKIQFLDNLLLKDIVVKDSGRTGVDLNTVTNVTLDQVSALDNGGAGIALRNAQGITVSGAQTNGNAWGGLALWAVGSEVLSDVTVTGSNFSGEPAGVFAQHQGTFENIALTGNTFTDNGVQITDQTGLNVLDLEAILADNEFDRSVTVHTNPISVPAIFSSIQDALDAAADGDSVLVDPGTYPGSLEIHQANLTLRSTAGAQETFIDPEGAFVGVRVFGGLGNVTVEGFTVFEDWIAAGIGQGLASREGTTFHVLNNVVEAPVTTTQHGNAIQVTGDGARVIGNTVSVPHQVSPDWSGSGILVFSVDDGLIAGNTVSSSPDDSCIAIGGDNFGVPAANNNVVEDNLVHGCGTGVMVQAGVHDTLVQNNEIRDNGRGLLSEALSASNPSGTVVTGNLFVNNTEQVHDEWEIGEPGDAPDLDLEAVLADNTFDRAVVVRDTSTGDIIVPTIFSVIQHGVDAAQPADTVDAAAGTYEEDVAIDKDLVLVGAPTQTVLVGSVHAQGSGSLLVEGLQVEATPAAPLKGVALATTGVADVDLVNNTFVANGTIHKVNLAFFAGLVDLSGASNVAAVGNSVTGDSQGTGGTSGIQIAYAGAGDVSVLIDGTSVQDHNGTAITLSGRNPDANITVANSVLSRNTDGLVVNQANFSSLEVLDNEVRNQTDIGIRMLGATQGETVLRHNQISGNGLGLVVGGESDPVDARYNWWGSEAGPILNDQANVFLTDYTPWCLDAECTLTEPVEDVTASLPLSQPEVPAETEKLELL